MCFSRVSEHEQRCPITAKNTRVYVLDTAGDIWHCLRGAAPCNPRTAALVASHTITVRAYALTAFGSDQVPTHQEALALT